jgi:hypothetical protein
VRASILTARPGQLASQPNPSRQPASPDCSADRALQPTTRRAQIPIARAHRTAEPSRPGGFPPLRLVRRLPTVPAPPLSFGRHSKTLNMSRPPTPNGEASVCVPLSGAAGRADSRGVYRGFEPLSLRQSPQSRHSFPFSRNRPEPHRMRTFQAICPNHRLHRIGSFRSAFRVSQPLFSGATEPRPFWGRMSEFSKIIGWRAHEVGWVRRAPAGRTVRLDPRRPGLAHRACRFGP